MTASVPFGIGPPNVAVIPVMSVVGGLDLTTVTAVSLDVQRPDGATQTWAATIQGGATATAMNVLYAFTGSEFSSPNNIDGTWRLAPMLTVPGGIVPVYHSDLYVTAFP